MENLSDELNRTQAIPSTRPEVAGADSQPPVETTLAIEEEGSELSISHEEFEGLQRELDQALAKADEHWKLYLGAHAEMENLRKRAEREVQNAHKFALGAIFRRVAAGTRQPGIGIGGGQRRRGYRQAAGGRTDAAAIDDSDGEIRRPRGESAWRQSSIRASRKPWPCCRPIRPSPTHRGAGRAKGYLLNERLIRPPR